MPCYTPLKGYKAKSKNKTGKRSIVFNPKHGYIDLPVTIPCGQCIGCRLERSRQWAVRCMHEADMHQDNCFITLTYDEEHLPIDESLNVKHFQKFMKRLRKSTQPKKIRYYHCGEYGSDRNRPHYHALIFNHEFTDKQYWKTDNGNTLHTSRILETLWGKGQCIIGEVTFDSAAYVAQYILKKQTGRDSDIHYEHITRHGFNTKLDKEYTTMSRRPGIGKQWYEKFKEEVYPDNFIIVNGKKAIPPKYYLSLFEKENKKAHKLHKQEVKKQAYKQRNNNTPERLIVRENCAKARQKLKSRQLEEQI